ncbi:polyisoprenoid-binding protein [Aeromicrobium sp. SMF47]|uniref:Polyisoprenoid-binding protein n=1 Tax=Aeromicrobium yanjiei TaxID=2662028 RepID=A0A5Q2MCF9_9ACTN|nr:MULTISPECIES: YceI family protein [Aeromicrobium]MRJ78165.1 polyisoprenoid-binding protein [Aeromicrobium yanjiei]MRK03203.1 polyisoprenoid-binding protein [Aeromicrobium sp. S22]QGG40767.1 polyisoprenoid-binding protein [Aeromicrobium yanjiei]
MSTAIAVTAGTWNLDPTHTEIGFTVRHLMSKVRGKFETFEGSIVTAENPADSSVKVAIDLSSINTGTADRDAHLRSGDFFGVDTYPTMTFTSTGVVHKGDNEFVVTGDLAIKDVTKPVELEVEFLGEGGDPWGGTRVGVEATTTISRKEFGIDFNIPVGGDTVMIGDKIAINIVAEAVLQA